MTHSPFIHRVSAANVCSNGGEIIRAKSPLRISFAGGGTDHPQYYAEHGGAVLSSTITWYAYVTLYPRDDTQILIRSLDLEHSVRYTADQRPIYDGVLDLAKAAIHRLGATQGMELDVRSDASPGSGLGGSSALTSSVLAAVATYTGVPLNVYELAELNYTIERVDLKIPGGKQDQYATTFGGFNLIEFHRDRVLVNPLRIDKDILNDLESHLLLCYTGRPREDHRLVDKHIHLYQQGDPTTLKGMSRLREMAYEMKEVLLRGELNRLGMLLDEAYENKKRINPDIVEGTLAEALYREAKRHGTLGGKLCGAGGGGYLLLYCATDCQLAVRRAVERLGGKCADLAFDGLGVQSWRSRWR